MDTLKANVVKIDDMHYINIETESGDVRIPMTEDKVDDVKRAFNKLIIRLKTGEFQIAFEGAVDDLFTDVAKEYLIQLNRDIHEVYEEMSQYELDQNGK